MPHYPYYTPNFESAKLQNTNVNILIRIVSVIFFFHLTLSTTSAPRKDSYKIRTIVIDAGHGGHDAGCLGSSSREKHVALDIALHLGKLIESNYPDVKVIYTRKTDVFIPLHERANIANKAHADLFICIHLNAGGKGAFGAETYIMGNHKTADNLEVAKRENDVVLYEEDYLKKYDGFDPNSPEANIIFSLYQSQFMSQSLLFASNIQEEFTDFAGRFNRGVKQAGFLVLYKTAMPAVLIECGFLTHEPEEKFLASDKGQHTMSNAIFRAFKSYKVDLENSNESTRIAPVIPVSADTQKTKSVQKEVIAEKNDSVNAIKEEPVIIPKPVIETPDQKKPANELTIDDSPEKGEKSSPSVLNTSRPTAEVKTSSVFITIQIGASKNPAADNKNFLKTEGVRAISSEDGYTRYVIGTYSNVSDAKKKLNEVKSKFNPDAFLSAYDGKKKITVQEAEQKIKANTVNW